MLSKNVGKQLKNTFHINYRIQKKMAKTFKSRITGISVKQLILMND